MKKQNFLSVLMVFSALALANQAYCAGNYNYTTAPAINNVAKQTLQGSVIYTPAGLTTHVVTSQPINSETAYQGEAVTMTMPSALVYNGKTIAPQGSMVTGSVIMVKKAGRGNRNAQIYIRFNAITTPQGFRVPISAIIKTEDNTGILKGGTKMDSAKDYAKNTAIGTAGGALLGTALGPLSGGSVGKGAVYGTAVGAGLGLIKGIADKGNTVEIPANATMQLYFDQPITIGAPSGYNY